MAVNSADQATRVKPMTKSTRAMHWFIAVGIFFLFVSSWWMLALPLPSDDFTYRVIPFQLHKNVGISLFLIAVILVIWRCRQIAIWRSQGEKFSQIRQAGHWLLYASIIGCCITGYISSSYSGWGTELWWIIQLPNWASENDELNALFSDLHLWSCWVLALLIAVHIAAALNHVLRNDGIIDSMFGSH